MFAPCLCGDDKAIATSYLEDRTALFCFPFMFAAGDGFYTIVSREGSPPQPLDQISFSRPVEFRRNDNKIYIAVFVRLISGVRTKENSSLRMDTL